MKMFSLGGGWAADARGNSYAVSRFPGRNGLVAPGQWEQVGGVVQAPVAH